MKRLLRILITLNWATAIAAAIVSVATRKYLPPELTLYLETRQHLAITPVTWIIFWTDLILLIVCLINSAGLFLLRKWAKTMLVPLYVVCYLLIPTNPVSIQTGWTRMLFGISSVIGGMIIALVFFSPLADSFERQPDAEHITLI